MPQYSTLTLKRKVEQAFNNTANTKSFNEAPIAIDMGKRKLAQLERVSDDDDDEAFDDYYQEKHNKPGPSGIQGRRESSPNGHYTHNMKSDMPDFSTPDECLFGSIVANRLKRLADDQKIYAEKIISDALHYAMLNRLSSASNVTL